RGPAARVAAPALAGLVRRELGRQLALLLRVEARAVADRPRVVGTVVEAEDERADRPLLLAGPPAHNDRVDRAHALDLAHPDPLARAVARAGFLGYHALAAAQPRLGLGAVGRARREVDRLGHELLQA